MAELGVYDQQQEDQNQMQARITLLESIKNLDKTKLDMLGQVMST